MGAYYRQALRAGVSDASFWSLTPYTVGQRIKAHGEDQVAQAWWSERFAREERLSSLLHYLEPKKPGDADDGDAFLATFALMHGQEVLDLSDSAESA